jgi:hypothetical protein
MCSYLLATFCELNRRPEPSEDPIRSLAVQLFQGRPISPRTVAATSSPLMRHPPKYFQADHNSEKGCHLHRKNR